MHRIIILLLLSSLAGGSVLTGQEESPAEEEDARPKITVHGFLWLEDLPTFTTTELDETRYWIVSLSTSF